MPQSLANILLHVTFSTKDRRPFLRAAVNRRALERYIAGILQNIDCPAIVIGAVENHVHILCNLARQLSVAKMVEQVKSASSQWAKQQSPVLAAFYWQNGYGAFSVSQSNMERVSAYIRNQEVHHRKRTFQEEMRTLLTRHKIEFDERYMWD